MSNKLTIGQDTYDLDQYEYIHLYNFVAMMGWVKKIGLYKSGDILKSDNYDWVLKFDEVDNEIYGEDKQVTEELLVNRTLFDQVVQYLKEHPQKRVVTGGDGACGWITKKC